MRSIFVERSPLHSHVICLLNAPQVGHGECIALYQLAMAADKVSGCIRASYRATINDQKIDKGFLIPRFILKRHFVKLFLRNYKRQALLDGPVRQPRLQSEIRRSRDSFYRERLERELGLRPRLA